MSPRDRHMPLFLTRDEAIYLALELGIRTWSDLDDTDRLSYARELRARETLKAGLRDLLEPQPVQGPDPRD